MSGAHREDEELLRAHVDGDPDAFALLFHRHRDRLWAVALRTIGDREDAADALQDALLSAHRAAPRFRGDSAVTTWLHRIVVNACLDRLRRRQAHPTVPLADGSNDQDQPRGVEPAAPAVDLDTGLVVRAALAKLPPDQRAAIVLVDLQGYPVAEAAAILGVAEGTIKSRCARGRVRLAGLLGHLRKDGDTTGYSAGAGPEATGGPGRAARRAAPTAPGSGTRHGGDPSTDPSNEPGTSPGAGHGGADTTAGSGRPARQAGAATPGHETRDGSDADSGLGATGASGGGGDTTAGLGHTGGRLRPGVRSATSGNRGGTDPVTSRTERIVTDEAGEVP